MILQHFRDKRQKKVKEQKMPNGEHTISNAIKGQDR